MANEPLDPTCPLGQVNEILRQRDPQLAEICTRRLHDENEDYRLLTRHVLFSFAKHVGIDVMVLAQQARGH